ncbi:adenosylcobalamin-dependent ribonucleoside-diphosphate reductase [bacterium]|nr:adenosylcobalamin-dependent ribonucleoside-diphosphate reductase [bacterium]
MNKTIRFFGKDIEVYAVDVEIKDKKGEVIFEKKGFEAPSTWSKFSVTIVANKYAMDYENSVLDIFERIIKQISRWGDAQGYFDEKELRSDFEQNLADILVNQRALFNSPVLFNCGVPENSDLCSACFILPTQDNMEDILDQTKVEGMIFKFGGGVGRNMSRVRGRGEALSNKGEASGVCSFNLGYDANAGIIKSGGRNRRSARLVCLDVDHPDLMEFIECKSKEEKKARILIENGVDEFEAAETVAFQNGNHSISVTDDFMECVKEGGAWDLINRGDGKVRKTLPAKEIFQKIVECAHDTGDPGLQFIDRINRDNPVPHLDRIRSSNPCSEFFAVDNSSCNLASLNLLKYCKGGEIDFLPMWEDIGVLITAMDIIVDNAHYPTKEIKDITARTRPLGLGFANLGAVLMNFLLPYDSETGRKLASSIMTAISYGAYLRSCDLAERMGSYEDFDSEVATKIVGNIFEGNQASVISRCIEEKGLRNSQLTLLAPTGTIGFGMGCDTSGCEPLFDTNIVKTMSDGSTVNIVSDCVFDAVSKLKEKYNHPPGTPPIDIINEFKGDQSTQDKEYGVFDTANEISWKGHIDMVAALQPYINMGISKTINLPATATVEDIWEAYVYAWEKGLKCISIYRDGSKANQPLTSSGKEEKEEKSILKGPPKSIRNKLPNTRPAKIHKFDIGGMEGYLIPGIYEDGSLGELFIKTTKQGSTVEGLLDAFATNLSYSIQHGVPLRSIVNKFKDSRFEPSGWTTNPDVPVCTSITDYIAKWIEKEFLEMPLEIPVDEDVEQEIVPKNEPISYDGDICNICGSATQRSGTCRVCKACGTMIGGCSG